MLKKVDAADTFGSDDVIRFGQKIKLQACEYFHKKVLHLGSTPQSNVIFSAKTRKQEASMHACDSFNTQWIVDHCNPNDRFERQGEPVQAGEEVLLRHINTGHYLASDLVSLKNDFHVEYEVSTHSFASLYKTQNLWMEKDGRLTTDVPTKYQGDQNVWSFETAPNDSFNAPVEDLQKFNVGELIADLIGFLKAKSSAEAYEKTFKAMDEAGAQTVDAEDFRWGLIDLGYSLSKYEAD